MTASHAVRQIVLVAMVASALLAVPAAPAEAVPTPVAGGFVVETAMELGGAFSANAMAFLPAEALVAIAHNDGRVELYGQDGTPHGEVLDLTAEVNTFSDRGLTGIAFHPSFSAATSPVRRMYLWYVWDPAGLEPDGQGRRISRLESVDLRPVTRAIGDAEVVSYEITPGSRRVILGAAGMTNPYAPTASELTRALGPDPDCTTCAPIPACGGPTTFIADCVASDSTLHATGTIRFGPDGTLWVGHGDGASAAGIDIRAMRSTNPDSLNGKVLRIDPVTGRGLADNPWWNGDATANRSRVYSGGLRNPFRFSVHPVRATPLIGDVGFSLWEEVNTGRGANHGWPCFEGGDRTTIGQPNYNAFDECKAQEAAQRAGTLEITPAIHAYRHPSGPGGDGAAIIGGDWYRGTTWPSAYDEGWFFTDFDSGSLRVLPAVRDGAGVAIGNAGPAQEVVNGLGFVVDTQLGPDGNLWILEIGRLDGGDLDGSGRILRLRHGAGQGQAPVVSRVPAQTDGIGGDVVLQVLASDPDGSALTFSADPAAPLPPGLTISPAGRITGRPTTAGTYPVTIAVSDGTSVTRTSFTWTIDGDQAPRASIAFPATPDGWAIGDVIAFRGSGTDPEDGALTGASLTWTVQIRHADHIHPDIYTGTGVAPAPFTITDHGRGWSLVACLTATDRGGRSDRACMDLRIAEATYTVRSDPPGLPVTLAGQTSTQPTSTVLYDGQAVALSAPLTAGALTFVGWSSGRASTQTLVGGQAPTDVVARYVQTTAPTNQSTTPGVTARQSGTHPFAPCGVHAAGRAIDGSTAGYEAECSISHTDYGAENGLREWWEVDLQGPRLVEEVRVHNWLEHSLARLSNGWVLVSVQPFGSRSLDALLADPTISRQRFTGTIGRPTTFPSGARGRYVRVQLEGAVQRELVMSEVEVIGGPLRPPVVVIAPVPQSPRVGDLVQLDATRSIDPDATPLRYQWSLAGDTSRFDDPTSATPVFDTSGLPTGPRSLTLAVTDSDGQTSSATVSLTLSVATPPAASIADTGGPHQAGSLVRLDASGSTDPAGGQLAHSWDLDDDGAFDDATGAVTTLDTTGFAAGPRTVRVRSVSAASGLAGVASRTLQITAPPAPPSAVIADTGGPHAPGAIVPLDASRSTDPAGGPLTFAWDLDADGAFDDATGPTTTFDTTGRAAGSVPVAVQVQSGPSRLTATATATVAISGSAVRPPSVVIAPPDGPFDPGSTIHLDASASTDPDGDRARLTFVWDTDGDGFDTADGVGPIIDVPADTLPAGQRVIRVRVTSGVTGRSTVGSTEVTVHGRPVAALAQPARPFAVDREITLDASGSSEPQGAALQYAWDTNGDGVYEPERGDGPTTAFPASSLGRGVHHAGVLVRSSLTGAEAHALIHLVVHEPPFAVLTAARTEVTAGESVPLDASGSSDPHGSRQTLTHRWDLDADGAFDDASGPQATLQTTGLTPGSHVVAVETLSTATGLSSVARTTVRVLAPTTAPPAGGTGGGGAAGGGGGGTGGGGGGGGGAAGGAGGGGALPVAGTGQADLSVLGILSSRDSEVGEPVEATLTVRNAGPDTAQALLEVELGTLLVDRAPDGCRVVGARLTCEAVVLAPDAASTLTMTVSGSTPGLAVATATVTAGQAEDPAPDDNTFTLDLSVGGAGTGAEVIAEAVALSRRRFDDAGGGARQAVRSPATRVVLSRVDDFADSLTGSVLTGDAPLLLTHTSVLAATTLEEVRRVLPPGGEVLVLGGPVAISDRVLSELTDHGFRPRRLAGPSRVETALAIADDAVARAGEPLEVALARATAPADNPTAAWADSVAAGGWAARTSSPILLTPSGSMHPAVAGWLDAHPDPARLLLGGEGALSPAVADAVGPHRRLAGPNRYATAAVLADELWDAVPGVLVTAGDHPLGWAYGLASAGLSAGTGQPLLLVERQTLPAESAARSCDAGQRLPLEVIGGASVVSAAVREALAGPC